MNRQSLRVMVAALPLIGGCHVGPQVSEMPVLRLPQGATVEIVVNAEDGRRRFRYTGELIEVGDTGLMLLIAREEGDGLYTVSWPDLQTLKATALAGFVARPAAQAGRRAEIAAEFRLISRFPQGLSDDLEAQLLAHLGQDAPADITQLTN